MFEFEGFISIVSGVESSTTSRSVIIYIIIKVLVIQVDHCFCEVAPTHKLLQWKFELGHYIYSFYLETYISTLIYARKNGDG